MVKGLIFQNVNIKEKKTIKAFFNDSHAFCISSSSNSINVKVANKV